jgi:hypothetical protein
MDFQDSISKPFKKLKHRLAKGSRKRKEGSGREDSREGREHDTEGIEAGQSSHLHPETEDVVGSGASREEKDGDGKKVVQVNPPTSMPPVPHSDSGKSNSM